MKTRLLIILIIGVASLGFLSADAIHDEQSSRGSDDPRIYIKGADAYVVWVEENGSEPADVYFTKITAGTKTKGPINITQGSSIYPRPQVHVYENNIYLLWEDRTEKNGIDQIYFSKSNDGGTSFSKPKLLGPNDQTIYRPFSINQVNDTVYVFGSNYDRATKQSNVVYFTSKDFGETFSEQRVVFNHEQSDQEIQVKVHNDTIYILSDDRNDFDEKGSIYLRKILPDGTLTDIVNVNGGSSAVTHPQFAVNENDVYVSWRDRVDNRWFQAFTKSNDGGDSFDQPKVLESDPKSIDTVGANGDFIFANENHVYVLWESEYWDGETQDFKTFIATSTNKGEDFTIQQVPLEQKFLERGTVVSKMDKNILYQMGITAKNPPFHHTAIYFSSIPSDESKEPPEILEDLSIQVDWMPDFEVYNNYVHFITPGGSDRDCILYSFSDDGGESFGNVVNLSPNGNDFECLGIKPNIMNPLKQVSLGTDIHEIQCKDDLSKGYLLALRERDDQPLCVMSANYHKMIERNFVSDKLFEIMALSAARDYLTSHPKISENILEESLKLQVYMTRHSIPPAFVIKGSFNSQNSIYSGDIDPASHNFEMIIVQNNKVHFAKLDDTFLLTDIEPESQHPLQSTIVSPTLKTVLSPGERINNNGLIPLVITEVSKGGYEYNTYWTFQSIGYQGDNRDKKWGILPDSYRISETVDENGQDAIDRERMPENFGIPLPLFIFPIFCGDERIEGESGWHYTLPTRTDTLMVYYRSTDKGIYPDQDGIYDIKFVSMFKTETDLPQNLLVISNQTLLCPMETERNDATHAYYTHLQFKIDDEWTASYYAPDSQVNSSEIHEHATILAKIFGDKFDFSQPKFHLQDPRINFEQTDPDTIHRISDDATLGLLFETLGMNLDENCFVFPDKREFCSNDEYLLKFYVNDVQMNDISQYLISEDDKILISYGPEPDQEIPSQFEELESIAKYNYFSLDKLMTMDIGTVDEGTYNGDLGFRTVEKLFTMDMKNKETQNKLETRISQKQHEYDSFLGKTQDTLILETLKNEITKLKGELDSLSDVKYTSEQIFQRVEEIEDENKRMYNLGVDKYEDYVLAKKQVEGSLTEKSLTAISVKINSDKKILEIILPEKFKNNSTQIEQYSSIIEENLPKELDWGIVFSD